MHLFNNAWHDFAKSIIPQTTIISHWPFKFAVFGTIEAHPSQGQRFARYDQANSTHTNMTHDEFGNIGKFKFPAIIDDSTSGALSDVTSGSGQSADAISGALSDATSGEGSGEQDNLFNNTIHLLDFLSQLIINQDPNNQNNTGCETWMTKQNFHIISLSLVPFIFPCFFLTSLCPLGGFWRF